MALTEQQREIPDGLRSLVLRLERYVSLSDHDLECLAALCGRATTFPKQHTLICEGDALKTVYLIEEGWAIRARQLEDGRRQIVNFLLPGDFFDMQVFVAKEADHSVVAITDVTAREIRPEVLLNLFKESSVIATALWWAAVQEEAILREQIVRVGSRTAYERTAHLILELNRRLQIVGKADEARYRLPVTQAHLADALGLSPVHVNRCLRRLIKEGLITLQSHVITINNWDALAEICDFVMDYLHLDASIRDFKG